MTRDDVRQAIVSIISDIAPDEDLSTMKDELTLRDQFDLDSMDFLDIVMELRKRFNLEVPEADYPKLASMASCVEYLFPRLKDKTPVG